MSTTATPHKAILAISRHLQTASTELARLTESLLPIYQGPLQSRSPAPVAAKPVHQPKAAPRKVPTQVAAQIARKIDDAVGAPRHLSQQEQADIIIMLTKTQVPVTEIAKLYGVKRPSIYNIRDKHKLNVHRGSDQLMAGIARHKARRRKSVRSEPSPAPAPVTPAVVEQVQQAALAEATG